VSDCDQAAKTEQKKFTGTGSWKRWDELSDTSVVVTSEDFVKTSHLKAALSNIKGAFTQLDALDVDSINFNGGGGCLHCIELWIGNAMLKDDKKSFLNTFKGHVFQTLSADVIEPHYYVYLEKLYEHMSVA
jgi:hypothetical protein